VSWITDVGTCRTCGKRCYLTKQLAKRAVRQMAHRQGRLNAYRCGDYWHLGHLPSDVVDGRKARQSLAPKEERG